VWENPSHFPLGQVRQDLLDAPSRQRFHGGEPESIRKLASCADESDQIELIALDLSVMGTRHRSEYRGKLPHFYQLSPRLAVVHSKPLALTLEDIQKMVVFDRSQKLGVTDGLTCYQSEPAYIVEESGSVSKILVHESDTGELFGGDGNRQAVTPAEL